MTPYSDRLKSELDAIEAEMLAVLDRSSIRYASGSTPDSKVSAVGVAEWEWGPSNSATIAARMALIRRYDAWHRRLQLLFPYPTREVVGTLTYADQLVRRWLAREGGNDNTVPTTIEEAKLVAGSMAAMLRNLLDIATHTDDSTIRLLPDTSSLLRNPDMASYGRGVATDSYHVHLVPTVLGELDKLKDRGPPDMRDQAKAVVRRLKGLRDKGHLREGVRLTKTVTVLIEHREVNPREVLDWLDPNVPDDRILAAALRLQSDHPGGCVVLVTSDLNLQNKADAAGLPCIETPPSPRSLQAALVVEIKWSSTTWHVPLATLRNIGPAPARGITYTLTCPAGAAPSSTAGPWKVEQLRRDESVHNPVVGFFPDRAVVTASWTDDNGDQQRTWTVPFPRRPSPMWRPPSWVSGR